MIVEQRVEDSRRIAAWVGCSARGRLGVCWECGSPQQGLRQGGHFWPLAFPSLSSVMEQKFAMVTGARESDCVTGSESLAHILLF